MPEQPTQDVKPRRVGIDVGDRGEEITPRQPGKKLRRRLVEKESASQAADAQRRSEDDRGDDREPDAARHTRVR
jgi:hypothetical protein